MVVPILLPTVMVEELSPNQACNTTCVNSLSAVAFQAPPVAMIQNLKVFTEFGVPVISPDVLMLRPPGRELPLFRVYDTVFEATS
jgi:hypothetical protein